jgi:hypothetical protein
MVRLSAGTAAALRAEGVWFENVPTIEDELEAESDHFLEHIPWVVDAVGHASDAITVAVAARETSAFLRKLIRHLRTQNGGQQPTEDVRVQASGPGGRFELELEKMDEEAAEHLAALLNRLT